MGETSDYIQGLFDEYKASILEFNGKCHDCNDSVKIEITNNNGELSVSGGGIWKFSFSDTPFFKCEKCFERDNLLHNFRPVEIFARVTGYIRPVKHWNPGKKEEFKDRKYFNLGGTNASTNI